MRGLVVTEQMIEQSIDDKFLGTVKMDPMDFLSLTVPNVRQWIEEERKEGTVQTVEMYNEFVRRGKIRIIPFLSVDKETGAVLGHEGRHRAIAMADAKQREMDIAIGLRVNGYKEYYEQPFMNDMSHPKFYLKRYFGVQDIPKRFLGQGASSAIVKFETHKFTSFYSAKETVLETATYKPNPIKRVGT